jgi:hypothetical protein
VAAAVVVASLLASAAVDGVEHAIFVPPPDLQLLTLLLLHLLLLQLQDLFWPQMLPSGCCAHLWELHLLAQLLLQLGLWLLLRL